MFGKSRHNLFLFNFFGGGGGGGNQRVRSESGEIPVFTICRFCQVLVFVLLNFLFVSLSTARVTSVQ